MDLFLHEGCFFTLAKSFDCVTQHGAGHSLAVGIDIVIQPGWVSLAGFAQHPPTRLVYELVFVVHKHVAEPLGVVEFAFAYERKCGNYGHAHLPW